MKLRYVRLVSYLLILSALSGCFGARSSDLDGQMNVRRLEEMSNIMPVAVIGSGPAGLMAAIYTARGGKDTFVIEGNKPGGLLMDTTEVENWPGAVSIQGQEIIAGLKEQAIHQGVQFVGDSVERIDMAYWPYTIQTENGQTFRALSVIVATGANPRKLGVPGEQEYWGAGVTACAVCDAPFYKGEDVVVVGGGDSAIEEAIQLAAHAKKITILVRRNRMRAAESMQDRLKQYDQIQVLYSVAIRKIIGDQFVTGVELYDNKTGQTITMPTSGVFLAIGHDPNSQIVKDVVETNAQGYVTVKGRTQETSVRGIFAAGDVADYRYRQAGTAAGYGIAAGRDAVNFLDDIGFTQSVAKKIKSGLFGADEPAARAVHETKTIETMDQFQKVIGQKGVAVLDFWADTCPSCKQMLPIFESVAQEFAGRAVFFTVDTEVAPEVTDKLFVHKIPCILIFKDGALVARYTNVMSRKELSMFVDQAIEGNLAPSA